MVFLLTDFLHNFGAAAGPRAAGRDTLQELGLTNARHDLICLHLHDPRESKLPTAGLLTIEDAETGELLEIDSSRAAVREKFADTNAERLAELEVNVISKPYEMRDAADTLIRLLPQRNPELAAAAHQA